MSWDWHCLLGVVAAAVEQGMSLGWGSSLPDDDGDIFAVAAAFGDVDYLSCCPWALQDWWQ